MLQIYWLTVLHYTVYLLFNILWTPTFCCISCTSLMFCMLWTPAHYLAKLAHSCTNCVALYILKNIFCTYLYCSSRLLVCENLILIHFFKTFFSLLLIARSLYAAPCFACCRAFLHLNVIIWGFICCLSACLQCQKRKTFPPAVDRIQYPLLGKDNRKNIRSLGNIWDIQVGRLKSKLVLQ